MSTRSAISNLAAATVIGLTLSLMATVSWANDCPADKVAPGATKPGPMANSGTTDKVIASIDLSSLGNGFRGRKMRVRRLVVAPGGIVQWHSHETRPANIYVISGSITEYRSTCAVPIDHPAGDVTEEFGPLAHWWRNNTRKPAVLLSADLLPPEMKPAASM